MASVDASGARAHLGVLLQRVERGEEITITRQGRAVARLVPAAPEPDAVMAPFRRLRDRARRSGLGRFDWAEWRAYRDHDRP
jgi:prevent-host-death family protein